MQVLNQYATSAGQRENRYDVTILVNGLPLVHVELKRRGVDIKEAFNQINRYNRESFWAGSGLFEYIQIFVISNGTYTKYYSNTTRFSHVKEQTKSAAIRGKRTSNSFEFTSWWADASNKVIPDLMDFAKTFFAKHSILKIITKYCVFTADRLLLVMRPYQIVATERIINKIVIANNYKNFANTKSGGYIWHTTGSGKTLTSFKTAQIASKLDFIEKVLFVVDRKDLDYQTMREYDRFEKGAANSNSSTAILKKQLENPDARIIITTIQKLSCFIKKYKEHPVYRQHIVFIFDECHRSQFGDMHTLITKTFKKYHLFGFTGTPIFSVNASAGGNPNLKTTQQAFGDKLHTYTIVNAIADKNVLPFKIDYVSTMREAENIEDEKVSDIDRERILQSPERIANIVRYILEHFDQKTKRNIFYRIKERRLAGFNSIFAVASIELLQKYYLEFKRQMAELPSDKRIKIATIFSFSANDDGDEDPSDTEDLPQNARDFLESAIADYNKTFKTNYDTSSDKFQNYYKDVSERVKKREVDLLLVVNMFLTGFDATTLNTLWVDKNLRMHGLLQAYSRTNRILNSVKTFGNIVCFRNLETETNRSIALFGDKEAAGIVLLKSFNDYYKGYSENGKRVRGYAELIAELIQRYPLASPIISEKEKKANEKKAKKAQKEKQFKTSVNSFFTDFKKFISKGNIVDLAVAVVIGAAFNKIVSSLVNDIIMPLISLLTGGVSVEDWKWVIKPATYDASGTLLTAETALRYGVFIQAIIDFLIIAFTLFVILKIIVNSERGVKSLKKRMHVTKEDGTKAVVEEKVVTPVKIESEEDILKDIRTLLSSQVATNATIVQVAKDTTNKDTN